jgi:hypothetical protein
MSVIEKETFICVFSPEFDDYGYDDEEILAIIEPLVERLNEEYGVMKHTLTNEHGKLVCPGEPFTYMPDEFEEGEPLHTETLWHNNKWHIFIEKINENFWKKELSRVKINYN